MQKITKCARQKILKYLNYLHIEQHKEDKKDTHTHTNIKLTN